MPHASTFTRTCPAPGSGISRSINSQSPPGLLICAAFIFEFIKCSSGSIILSYCWRLRFALRTAALERSTQAARDMKYFSRDPSAIRRRQKSRDRRNILRLPEATERCLCDHLFLKVAARESQYVKTFSLNSTWIDRVHANLLWRKFLGQHPRNGTNRALGSCVNDTRRRVQRSYA